MLLLIEVMLINLTCPIFTHTYLFLTVLSIPYIDNYYSYEIGGLFEPRDESTPTCMQKRDGSPNWSSPQILVSKGDTKELSI